MKCLFTISLCLLIQENVKTKHPQLLYESKLYKILQGGSNFYLSDLVAYYVVSVLHYSA